MGGPCDHQHHGDTADDVINVQDQHLKEMVANGDDTHSTAAEQMKGRWKRPISGMKWYRTASGTLLRSREDEAIDNRGGVRR